MVGKIEDEEEGGGGRGGRRRACGDEMSKLKKAIEQANQTAVD